MQEGPPCLCAITSASFCPFALSIQKRSSTASGQMQNDALPLHSCNQCNQIRCFFCADSVGECKNEKEESPGGMSTNTVSAGGRFERFALLSLHMTEPMSAEKRGIRSLHLFLELLHGAYHHSGLCVLPGKGEKCRWTSPSQDAHLLAPYYTWHYILAGQLLQKGRKIGSSQEDRKARCRSGRVAK